MKVWLSSSVFDIVYYNKLNGLNPNSDEYEEFFNRSRLYQIDLIRMTINNHLEIHEDVKLDGYYLSKISRYYTCLIINNEYDLLGLPIQNSVLFDELLFIRLKNTPKIDYAINLDKEYEQIESELLSKNILYI